MDTPGAQVLAGTTWRAEAILDQRHEIVGDEHTTQVTAVFGADGNLTGVGGCNRYGGRWSTEGGALVLGPIRRTLMAGDGLATEDAYLAALARVRSYDIEADTLRLRDADGATVVVFRRADPVGRPTAG